MAMGLDKARARASLRFSLLKTATDADVNRVLQIVPEAVEHLRAISPVSCRNTRLNSDFNGYDGTSGTRSFRLFRFGDI